MNARVPAQQVKLPSELPDDTLQVSQTPGASSSQLPPLEPSGRLEADLEAEAIGTLEL